MTLVQKQLIDSGIKTEKDFNGTAANSGTEKTAEEIAAEEAAVAAAAGDKAKASEIDITTALDDAKLLESLKARGINVENLDDLKPKEVEIVLTEEQKKEKEQQKRNSIRAYALQNNIVSSTTLDTYAQESQMNDVDLAFNNYKAAKLLELADSNTTADDMPSEQEIRAEFDEINFQYADETDPKRKTAEKRLKKENDAYLQDKYSGVYNMEHQYDEHVTTTSARKKYDATVNEAFSGLGETMEYAITPDSNKPDAKFKYQVKFSDAEIKAIKDLYTSDVLFRNLGETATKQDVEAAVKASIYAKYQEKILNEVSLAHTAFAVNEMRKGRRGIPPDTAMAPLLEGERKVSPGVKKVLAQNGVQATN